MKYVWLILLLAGLVAAAVISGCKKGDSAVSPTNTTGTGGSTARFTILGNYLYTVDHQNLKVFHISNPASLEFVKSVRIGFEIETIYPFKDKLFIGSTSAVYFYSVADPANPVLASEAIEPRVLRRCDPVVANDSVAYATLNGWGPCGGMESLLVVYNIKNLAQPIKMTTRQLTTPSGLAFRDSVLYVCDGSELRLYNIKDPWNPIYQKALNDGTYLDVIPYRNLLICWVKKGMVVYRIDNPAEPQMLAEIL